MSPSRRAAYTLIELLVTVAIIALLVALLMPAVQKVRESASRAKCTNHLKQIGLAFASYDTTFRYLPTAGSNTSGNPPADRRDWGWTYEILPQLEQGSVRMVADNAEVRRTVLPVYHCPSKRAAVLYNGKAMNDYAANGGTRLGSDSQDGPVVKFGTPKVSLTDDIPDGLSNTILLGEKRLNFATMAGRNPQDHSDNEAWAGPGYPTADIIRGAKPSGSSWFTPAPDHNRPGDAEAIAMRDEYRFGSSHPGGVVVVLADGSVRQVRYQIAPVMFMRLCVRNDRQPVSFE
ncbi:MAG: hypothetical protein C0501_17025 [Isosphaera sp.]|nr:hypothetical protein [Isosphaera sp.]